MDFYAVKPEAEMPVDEVQHIPGYLKLILTPVNIFITFSD